MLHADIKNSSNSLNIRIEYTKISHRISIHSDIRSQIKYELTETLKRNSFIHSVMQLRRFLLKSSHIIQVPFSMSHVWNVFHWIRFRNAICCNSITFAVLSSWINLFSFLLHTKKISTVLKYKYLGYDPVYLSMSLSPVLSSTFQCLHSLFNVCQYTRRT